VKKVCICDGSSDYETLILSSEAMTWMINELEKAVKEAPTSSVNVRIHVTGEAGPDDESENEKAPTPGAALSYPWYGRADVRGMIRTAAADNRTMGVAGEIVN
jgi:hypothetical protein